MKIHDEMSQIPVPEDLDEKHINPFYALKKQYKKIDFEKSVRGRYYPVW